MAVFGLGWVSNALGSFGSWFGSFPAKLTGGQGNARRDEGGGTWANRPATPEQALQLAAFWACVKLIGQTVGTLPVRLYTLNPDRSRTEAFDDPLYDLLQSQPNADFTGVEFWEGVAFCLALWGNAYAAKSTRADGSLISIELLRPFWMTVVKDRNTGETVYQYSDPQLGYTEFRREDLLHVRGFGACDVVALAPIRFARQTIGSALAAEESAGRLFSNGMRVGGWFKYTGANKILTSEQREEFRRALVEPYTGTENAHKAGMLPGDVDWLATSMNAEDAQLLANRRMNVEEICRWFGIPPILIGHAAEGQTMWGTGQESIVRSFLTMGLRPLVHRIEACIARDIIGKARRATMKAEFDLSELVRGDTKVQGDIDSQDVNNGLRTRNEVRASRNLPPMPGGDTLTVQSALIPIDMLGKVPPTGKLMKPADDPEGGGDGGVKLIEHDANEVPKGLRDFSFSWEGVKDVTVVGAIENDGDEVDLAGVTDDDLTALFAPELLEQIGR